MLVTLSIYCLLCYRYWASLSLSSIVAYFRLFVVAYNFTYVEYLLRIVICQLLVLCHAYLLCPFCYHIFISIYIDINDCFYSIAFWLDRYQCRLTPLPFIVFKKRKKYTPPPFSLVLAFCESIFFDEREKNCWNSFTLKLNLVCKRVISCCCQGSIQYQIRYSLKKDPHSPPRQPCKKL